MNSTRRLLAPVAAILVSILWIPVFLGMHEAWSNAFQIAYLIVIIALIIASYVSWQGKAHFVWREGFSSTHFTFSLSRSILSAFVSDVVLSGIYMFFCRLFLLQWQF